MANIRSLTLVAALTLAGAAYAQNQATPDTTGASPTPVPSTSQDVPRSQDLQTPQSAQPSLEARGSSPAAAAHLAAADASQRLGPGMPVKSPAGDNLGSVASIVPGSGEAEYVVIAGEGGQATPVPYAAATSMIQGDKLVIDKERLQSAPKVQHNQMEDSTNVAWEKKADKYWGGAGATDLGAAERMKALDRKTDQKAPDQKTPQ